MNCICICMNCCICCDICICAWSPGVSIIGFIGPIGPIGPIGGIPLKMVAAHDIGAQLFLVPADNCAEALDNTQPGLPMAKVATLDDALTALDDLRAGKTPPSC